MTRATKLSVPFSTRDHTAVEVYRHHLSEIRETNPEIAQKLEAALSSLTDRLIELRRGAGHYQWADGSLHIPTGEDRLETGYMKYGFIIEGTHSLVTGERADVGYFIKNLNDDTSPLQSVAAPLRQALAERIKQYEIPVQIRPGPLEIPFVVNVGGQSDATLTTHVISKDGELFLEKPRAVINGKRYRLSALALRELLQRAGTYAIHPDGDGYEDASRLHSLWEALVSRDGAQDPLHFDGHTFRLAREEEAKNVFFDKEPVWIARQ